MALSKAERRNLIAKALEVVKKACGGGVKGYAEGGGTEPKALASLDDRMSDPMRLIARSYAPRSENSIAGRLPGQEDRLSPLQEHPTLAFNPGLKAALEYGSLPAKFATSIAMQPIHAGEALGDAIVDPSLANVTNAGAQTAMALFRPSAALKTLAAGYGLAGARDAGLDPISVALAQTKKGKSSEPLPDMPGLTTDQVARYVKAQKDLIAGNFDGSAGRKALQDELKALSDISAEASRKSNSSKIENEDKAKKSEIDTYNRGVSSAETARDKALARDKRFSDSELGKMYDKTGGAATIMAGAVGGAGQKAINMALGNKGIGWNYGVPLAEGALLGATANNVPLLYNGWGTETENPERRAYLDYSRELPDNHPSKASSKEYALGLPEINPVRSSAQKDFYDGLAGRVASGAMEGAGGALLGSMGVGTTQVIPALARAAGRGTMNTLEGAAAAPGKVLTAYQQSMLEADLARAKRLSVRSGQQDAEGLLDGSARTAREMSRTADDALLLEGEANAPVLQGRPGTSGSQGQLIPEQTSPEIGRALEIAQKPRLADRLQDYKASQPLALESPSNSPVSSPKYLVVKESASGIHYPKGHVDDSGTKVGGRWVPHELLKNEPVKEVAKKAKTRAASTKSDDTVKSSTNGKASSDDSFDPLNKPARSLDEQLDPSNPLNRGRNTGGSVMDTALSTARKYADGGHVHSGPIMGIDGGRADTRPISVPAGAYVVPADVVSGIDGAGGNTMAGMRRLEEMFGKSEPARADGGAVPIKISDGEYVLSPDQVARVGGGDVEAGHRALDEMVRKVRADHIKTLSSLPGPAQS